MAKDSTNVQIAEGQAGPSSTETAIKCKTCRKTYKNRFAFAGHRRQCKSIKEPVQCAKSENKMFARNTKDVIAIWGQPLTETEWDALDGLLMLRFSKHLVGDDEVHNACQILLMMRNNTSVLSLVRRRVATRKEDDGSAALNYEQ